MSKLVGYTRVSTDEQVTDLQRDALAKAGVTEVFEDAGVSAVKRRPELERAIASLAPGDTLVVYRLDRLARGVLDLLGVVQRIEDRGAHFRSLSESIDTGSAAGRLQLNMLAAVGQFERDLLRERTREGLQAAKRRGKKLGREPVVPLHKLRALRNLIDKGESVRSAAEALGVSKTAAYDALKRAGM
jgi:DNA invertase Pin-like site-specific DNA recombinase